MQVTGESFDPRTFPPKNDENSKVARGWLESITQHIPKVDRDNAALKFAGDVLDFLSKGQYASANAAMALRRGDWDVWKPIIRGIKGEEKGSYRDVVQSLGLPETPGKIGADDILGLVGDIFLDPTTYIGIGGLTKLGRGAKALQQLNKARKLGGVAGETAERVFRESPKFEEIIRKAMREGRNVEFGKTVAEQFKRGQRSLLQFEVPSFRRLTKTGIGRNIPVPEVVLPTLRGVPLLGRIPGSKYIPIFPPFPAMKGVTSFPIPEQLGPIFKVQAAAEGGLVEGISKIGMFLREDVPGVSRLVQAAGKAINPYFRPAGADPQVWEDLQDEIRVFKAGVTGGKVQVLDQVKQMGLSDGPIGRLINKLGAGGLENEKNLRLLLKAIEAPERLKMSERGVVNELLLRTVRETDPMRAAAAQVRNEAGWQNAVDRLTGRVRILREAIDLQRGGKVPVTDLGVLEAQLREAETALKALQGGGGGGFAGPPPGGGPGPQEPPATPPGTVPRQPPPPPPATPGAQAPPKPPGPAPRPAGKPKKPPKAPPGTKAGPFGTVEEAAAGREAAVQELEAIDEELAAMREEVANVPDVPAARALRGKILARSNRRRAIEARIKAIDSAIGEGASRAEALEQVTKETEKVGADAEAAVQKRIDELRKDAALQAPAWEADKMLRNAVRLVEAQLKAAEEAGDTLLAANRLERLEEYKKLTVADLAKERAKGDVTQEATLLQQYKDDSFKAQAEARKAERDAAEIEQMRLKKEEQDRQIEEEVAKSREVVEKGELSKLVEPEAIERLTRVATRGTFQQFRDALAEANYDAFTSYRNREMVAEGGIHLLEEDEAIDAVAKRLYEEIRGAQGREGKASVEEILEYHNAGTPDDVMGRAVDEVEDQLERLRILDPMVKADIEGVRIVRDPDEEAVTVIVGVKSDLSSVDVENLLKLETSFGDDIPVKLVPHQLRPGESLDDVARQFGEARLEEPKTAQENLFPSIEGKVVEVPEPPPTMKEAIEGSVPIGQRTPEAVAKEAEILDRGKRPPEDLKRDSIQMLEDNIATKRSKGEQVPQAWLNKLDQLKAEVAGREPPAEGSVASLQVFGHPQATNIRPEEYGGLVPIRFSGSPEGLLPILTRAQRKMQDLGEKIGRAEAIANKKMKGDVKSAKAYLASMQHTEDVTIRDLLRDETLPELNRLLREVQGLERGKRPVESPPRVDQHVENVKANEIGYKVDPKIRELRNKIDGWARKMMGEARRIDKLPKAMLDFERRRVREKLGKELADIQREYGEHLTGPDLDAFEAHRSQYHDFFPETTTVKMDGEPPAKAAAETQGKPRKVKKPAIKANAPVDKQGNPVPAVTNYDEAAKALPTINRNNFVEVLEQLKDKVKSVQVWREDGTEWTEMSFNQVMPILKKAQVGDIGEIVGGEHRLKYEPSVGHAEYFPEAAVIEVYGNGGEVVQFQMDFGRMLSPEAQERLLKAGKFDGKDTWEEAVTAWKMRNADHPLMVALEKGNALKQARNAVKNDPGNAELQEVANDAWAAAQPINKGADYITFNGEMTHEWQTRFRQIAMSDPIVNARAGKKDRPVHVKVKDIYERQTVGPIGKYKQPLFPVGSVVEIDGQVGLVRGYSHPEGPKAGDPKAKLRMVELEDGSKVGFHVDDLLKYEALKTLKSGESILDWFKRIIQRQDGSIDLDLLTKTPTFAKLFKHAQIRRGMAREMADEVIRLKPGLEKKRQSIIDWLDALAATERSRGLLNGFLAFYFPHVRDELPQWAWLMGRGKIRQKKEFFEYLRGLEGTVDDLNASAIAAGIGKLFNEDLLVGLAVRGIASDRAVRTFDFIDHMAGRFGVGLQGVSEKDFDSLTEVMRKMGVHETRIERAVEIRKRLDELVGRTTGEQIEAGREIVKKGEKEKTAEILKLKRELDEITPEVGLYVAKGAFRNFPKDNYKQLIEQGKLTTDEAGAALSVLTRMPAPKSGDHLIMVPMSKLYDMVQLKRHVQGYLMPVEIANAMNGSINNYVQLGDDVGPFLEMFDAIQNTWKAWTLSIFPVYHTRNMIGNLWNSHLAGLRDPGLYSEALRLQMNDLDSFDDGLGITWKGEELQKMLTELGVVNRGWMAAEIPRALEQELAPVLPRGLGELKDPRAVFSLLLGDRNMMLRFGNRVGRAIENNARIALFMDGLREGLTPFAASERVKKYLFDYSDLTPFERNVMKRIFPFYSWSRFNIPLQLEHLVSRPGKFLSLLKTKELVEEDVPEPPDETLLPQWMKDQMPVRVRQNPDGTFSYFLLGGWVPAADAMKVFDPGGLALDMLTPTIKAPFEYFANYSLYFQDNIERYPGETGEFLGRRMTKRQVNLARNVRVLNTLDRLVYDKDLPAMDRWMNFFVGRYYPVNYNSEKEHREYEIGRDIRNLEYGLKKEQEKVKEDVKTGTRPQLAPGAVNMLKARIAELRKEEKRLKGMRAPGPSRRDIKRRRVAAAAKSRTVPDERRAQLRQYLLSRRGGNGRNRGSSP